jgi:hypothetical protein
VTEKETLPAFDLYRFLVEMADRSSARRGTANAFFLTLHTGLSGFAGLVVTRSLDDPNPDRFGLILVGSVGLILCAAWSLLIRSYRLLNNAKFTIINELEERFDIQPFTREWALLKREGPIGDRRKPRYAELSVVEVSVPIAFGLVYVALIVMAAVA